MNFSIIIPTYNEEENILNLLNFLKSELIDEKGIEIIVSDGGSTDKTLKLIEGFNVNVLKSDKGRGVQLNFGAESAKGNIFYFIHADSIPPPNFYSLIQKEIAKGFEVGCFQLKFTPSNSILRFYEYFVRFPFIVCRGGDQSLFITKQLYQKIEGFNPNLKLMEDIDLVKRVSKISDFKIVKDKVKTSSRKFMENGVIRLQLLFAIMHLLFFLGTDNNSIYNFYKKTVN